MKHDTEVIQRSVQQIVTAHRQTEGGGFFVRRPLPTQDCPQFDPFLLIDEMGPVLYGPGEAMGAPDHPHRGFETITYLLQGEVEHKDSAGHHSVLKSGDVQWMTAGSGVVHSEMPSRQLLEDGGSMHGFQIWVNLPARLKMTIPRYQEVPGENIPTAVSADRLASGRVIAGEALGVRGIIDTHTPIVYQDWTLKPGADVSIGIDDDLNVGAYVFSGSLLVGSDLQRITDGQFAVLGTGSEIRFQVPSDERSEVRLLLLGGVPIGEPVARYGPFVMTTNEELQQAFKDYQNGRMGQIHQ